MMIFNVSDLESCHVCELCRLISGLSMFTRSCPGRSRLTLTHRWLAVAPSLMGLAMA